MPFDPTLAAIRFGSGLSPKFAPPRSAAELLAEINEAPPFRVAAFEAVQPTVSDFQAAFKRVRDARDTAELDAREQEYREVRIAANDVYYNAIQATMARHVGADFGFAERLCAFWADHFTVKARSAAQRHMVTSFVEDAIRPYLNGSFARMLKAVAMHPMMLIYLEQVQSVGPESAFGKRQKRGLNENLAREMLELHTLGVNGSYDQTDVTEFAELLTGLTYQPQRGMFYDPRFAEPGPETVLGVTYDADGGVSNILEALDNLAINPETAHHISTKIAAEFVGDAPDAALVDQMTAAYLASDGHLPDVYAAMLEHPASWGRKLEKIKSPQRFITSGMRALGVSGLAVDEMSGRDTRNLIMTPLRVMGQPWENPNGPDGWLDDSSAWISAQGMAGRISWAMSAPRILITDTLPDPREFVTTALGQFASADVIFAAGAAEARQDGVGLVLASPAFQRS